MKQSSTNNGLKIIFCLLIFLKFNNSFAGGIITSNDPDIYVLSIGINDANVNIFSKLEFRESDADKVTQYFMNSRSTSKPLGSIFAYTLHGADATKDSIIAAIKDISHKIKPNDIFVFFFAGHGFEGHINNDSNGLNTIFFLPRFKQKELATFSESKLTKTYSKTFDPILQGSISLVTLKNLLDLIQARNQLIISEAGSSGSRFSEYLSNTFVDKDILNAQSNKGNRVFITTYGFGMETVQAYKFAVNDNCNYQIRNDELRGGPIVYFLTHLDSLKSDVFSVFENKVIERKFHFLEELNSCSLYNAYTNFIYERDILKIVSSVANTIEKGSSRGNQLLEEESKPKNDKSPVPPKKNYALLIGTDRYSSSVWNALKNPIYDVQKIDTLLRNNYNFETEVLLDASRQTILAALKKYSKMEFDSSSQLLVFIAGHGLYDDNNFGLIACADSKDPKDDEYLDTYISHSRLRDNLNAIPCNHMMVVLDVCFGGTFNQSVNNMQFLNSTDETNIDAYQNNQLSNADFARRLMGDKTRIYLTSGGKEYVPDGTKGNHSPFASGFIKALESNGGKDKVLNCGEIRSKVIRLVPQPRGGTYDSGANGDFVFIAR